MIARLALCLLVCVSLPAVALADHVTNRSYPVQAGYKFTRGIGNVITSPFEIPYNSVKEAQNVAQDSSNLFEMSTGLVVGLFTGVAYMCTRIGTGLWDTVTFPVPSEPLMYPTLTPNVLELALNAGEEK